MRITLASLALVAALGVGCHSSSSDGGSPGAQPSSTSVGAGEAAAPSPQPSASAPPVRPPPPVCRAASVGGGITFTGLAGTPRDAAAPFTLVASSDIPDDVWVNIDKVGKLTAKHPRSTRETTFVGPSRVRPCVLNREEGWLASGKFDIILTDINMPIMDGLKLVKRVRSDPTHKNTPIIIITTEGSDEDRQRALQLGANAYITKPIQAPQVIAKVKELLKIAP